MEINEHKAAQIILSIGTHRKYRVLDPITVAEELKKLCEKIPRKEVARRFKIADRTLRIYFKLLNLSESVKELVRSRKIPQDIAYRLTFLSKEDQEDLAKRILETDLTNKEVRAIVQTLKRRNPDMPIEQCIELVLKYRPRAEEEFLIVTKLEPKVLSELNIKSKVYNLQLDDLLKEIMSEVIPADGLSFIKTKNEIVFLALNKQGRQAYKNAVKKMRIKDFQLLNVLVQGWIQKHAS